MKTKIITAATAVMLLAACNTNDIPTPKTHAGTTLKAIHADMTRTQFDGAATAWTEGDAMRVFIDDGSGTKVYRFEVTDPERGIFRNDEITLDSNTEYEFHAVWTATDTYDSADTPNAVALDIGAAEQTQNGTSPSHVAALDPLTGSAVGRPADTSIPMKHSATLLRLTIRNSTDNNLAGIASVKVTAPYATVIAGRHLFDIESGTAEAVANATANSIMLSVNDSGEIAADGEFTAWAAAAPFNIKAGDKLTFTVTSSDGRVFEIEKSFTDDKSFSAGKIMATTIELSAATAAEEIRSDVDLSDPSTYPEDFPTNTADAVTSGTYIFGGRAFTLECKNGYFFSKSNNALTFKQIIDGATIAIPVIQGYAPSKITITNAKTSAYIKIAVETDDQSLDEKRTQAETTKFELSDTADNVQYYIKIFGTNNNASLNYSMSKLTIEYSRI